MSTDIEGLFHLARMGFNVIPFGMQHRTLGNGWMHLDGEGLRFIPDDKNKEPFIRTWAEFDGDKLKGGKS